jgi:hypothetical protein
MTWTAPDVSMPEGPLTGDDIVAFCTGVADSFSATEI